MKKWSENFYLIVPRESVACVRLDHGSCDLAAGSAIWSELEARTLQAAALRTELHLCRAEVRVTPYNYLCMCLLAVGL